MSVAAVVPHYREAADSVHRTVAGIVGQSLPPKQVVLVDDGSPRPIHLDAPWADLVRRARLAENMGVSAARNLGAACTSGRFLLFVNCDVVLAPDWVRRAVHFMLEHPDVALVGGAVVPRVGRPAVRRWRLQHIETRVHRVAPPAPVRQGWIVGHAMLVRRSAFERIGGFDARFRSAGDEVDLCVRLCAAGFGVFHLPFVVADSFEPATIETMARKSVRNSGWSLGRTGPPCAATRPLRPLPAALSTLGVLAGRVARDVLRGRPLMLLLDLAVAARSLVLIGRASTAPGVRSPAARRLVRRRRPA